MIDLHCHLLPGIDDGAGDLATSVAMATMAVADGITTTFCTPHIYPGLYENTGADIARRVELLRQVLTQRGIALDVRVGADAHLVPEFVAGLRNGRIPTLAGSRYVLLEPSHHVRPPRFVESAFEVIAAGYVPIITHPERLTWFADHRDDFYGLARSGAWLQLTGGALIGRFGERIRRISEQLVADGWIDVLASDGHSTGGRAPVLSAARARAAELAGQTEADAMVLSRPRAVLTNRPAALVGRPPAHSRTSTTGKGKIASLFDRIRSGRHVEGRSR